MHRAALRLAAALALLGAAGACRPAPAPSRSPAAAAPVATANAAPRPAGALLRDDVFVAGEGGLRLHLRSVCPASGGGGKVPLVLVHGARVPGVASFDLDVPGGSLAAELAAAGHCAHALDVRGYGASTRPPEMSAPPEANPPLVRSNEAVRDVGAAVDWVRARSGGRPVALLGWAVGGHWAGHYASLYTEKVSHLILYNALYGPVAEHPLFGRGSDLEDKGHPGRFDAAAGAYRFNGGDSLLRAWERGIPEGERAGLRDPAVAAALVREALASDPTSGTRSPPSFRSPNGAFEDSFYLASGRQLWDASLVRAATLVLRSGADFWSRPADVERLREHLVHARRVCEVSVPGASHFVHLDRPERGREAFVRALLAFLAEA